MNMTVTRNSKEKHKKKERTHNSEPRECKINKINNDHKMQNYNKI